MAASACRYAFPTVQLFREIREELIWADGGAVKKATDAALLSLLGPKTEADLQAGKKKPAKKVSRYPPPCNPQHRTHICYCCKANLSNLHGLFVQSFS